MAILTAKQRKNLPKSKFGKPGTRDYPMPDRRHAGNAKSRASSMLRAGKLGQSAYDKIISMANRILKK